MKNAKRTFVTLLAVAMLMSVFAVGPAAATQQCAVGQESADNDVADVDVDPNVQAGNLALSVPVLSPGANAEADSYSTIYDGNDVFGSNQVANVSC